MKVRVVISELGRVVSAEAISGPELLRSAAVADAKHWPYRPFERKGQRVAVTTVLDISFSLMKDGKSDSLLYQEHYGAAMKYQMSGDYSSAVVEAQKALAFAERDMEAADSLKLLAFLKRHQGQYSEAEELLRKRLKLLEKSTVNNPPEIAAARADLGYVLVHRHEYKEAEALVSSAIPVLKKYRDKWTQQDSKTAYDGQLSLANFVLASIEFDSGKVVLAETYAKKSIELGEKALPIDDRVALMRSYAVILRKESRDDEAAKWESLATALQLGVEKGQL